MTASLTPSLFFQLLLLGYLLGSVPFGLLLTRLSGLGDVRAIGSGNIGATNVLRTGRKGLAAATLLLDMGKGLLASLLGAWFLARMVGPTTPPSLGGYVAGFGALLGHCFPIWLRFRGGKGVATYIGALLGAYWPAGLLFCLVWLATAVLFRISSLSALTATVAVALLSLWHAISTPTPPAYQAMTFTLLAGGLLVFMHRANIARLLAGTEPRIGKGT